MTEATWKQGKDRCPECEERTQLLEAHNMAGEVLILAERCVRCRWQMDLSGASPRKVKYIDSR